MSSIISVSNLSKAYRIGKKAERADSFVGMLQDSVTAPFRNWRRMRQPTGESLDSADELHWALRDVSFEVKEGEVLGVIGRNGAGKSTLLKILSRITEPTSGEVRIRGRVASLLEVGTGFHPELTGRENVYLNGTILGMSRKEIAEIYDAIVDFSGIEKFLETPIKRYSSGMKVRLAFAVAAFLKPEILIVDEVLAVGDVEFQRKCLGKIQDISASGRTILFVSHNLGVLNQICSTCILMQNGSIIKSGSTVEVISEFSKCINPSSPNASDLLHTNKSQRFQFLRVSCVNAIEGTNSFYFSKQPIFRIGYKLQHLVEGLIVTVAFYDHRGYRICFSDSSETLSFALTSGENEFVVSLPPRFFAPGSFRLGLFAHVPNVEHLDQVPQAVLFDIIDDGSKFSQYANAEIGLIDIKCSWSDELNLT